MLDYEAGLTGGVLGESVVGTGLQDLTYGALRAEKKTQNQSLTKLNLLMESAALENEKLRRRASELERKCELLRHAVSLSRSEEEKLAPHLARCRREAKEAHETRDSVLGAKYVILSRLQEKQTTRDTTAQQQLQRTSDELSLARAELRRLEAHVNDLAQRYDDVSRSLVATKLDLAQTAARADDLRSAIALEHARRKAYEDQHPDTFATTLRRTFVAGFAARNKS